MRKVSLLAIVATMVAAAQAGTIYDSMGMIPNGYFIANGNVDGSVVGMAVGQPFNTTRTEFVITEVEVANLTFGVLEPREAVVSVFGWDWDSNKPRENPLYRETVPVRKNTSFSDSIFGLFGVRSTISDLNIALDPSTKYLMVVQVIASDAWTPRRRSGDDAWMRDQSSFGAPGGYGWTTWRSGKNSGYGEGEAAYRIEAIPEPTALGLLALGALGLLRRR